MPGCSASAELCQRCADIPSARMRDDLAKYKRAVTRELHRDMDTVLHAHDADTYENRLHAENEARMAECAALRADLAAAHDRIAVLETALRTIAAFGGARHPSEHAVELMAAAARAPLATTGGRQDLCNRTPASSRTCERGTKCCTVRHGKAVKL